MTRTERKQPQSAKHAGVCLHFTSLPSPHGIGDIGSSARRMIDDLVRMGLSIWQFLPTGPTGYGDSPYQPLSVLAGNELLIDLVDLVSEGLLQPEEVKILEVLPEGYVDYAQVASGKSALLGAAARRFAKQASVELKAEYERFIDATGSNWLDDYAMFRAIKTQQGEQAWPQWPQQLARRDPAALTLFRVDFAEQIECVRVLQFLFDHQWRALQEHASNKGIGLFGDLPIYVALDSADAWSHPELLQIDDSGRPSRVAGAPPDQFNPDGQLWGNPLYDWGRHKRSGYRWWIDRIRTAIDRLDLVRMDHFRGIESYWSVVSGETTAKNGEWRPGPGDAFFDALKNAIGKPPIVAENLGDITPAVEALRRRHGIPGMKVLQFEVDNPDFDPQEIAADCVCYTGTHDCDTTYGWFHGSRKKPHSWAANKNARQNVLKLTGGKPRTIHLDMIRLAFSTPARIAIAPMQDYLGLGTEARLNIPGTTGGNWAWRLRPGQLTAKAKREIHSRVDAAGRV